MMKAPICLTGGNSEARRALGAVLVEGPFAVLGNFDDAAACAAAGKRMAEPDIILVLAIAADSSPDQDVDRLRQVFMDAHLVVLGDNPERERLGACVAAGASGYLPWSISPAALIQTLRLIQLGERLFIAGSTGARPQRQPPERRHSPRRKTLQGAQIVFNDQNCVIDGTILDISDGGAKIRPADLLTMPSRFDLRVKYGPTYRCAVVRRSGFNLGVQFEAAA